MKKKNIEKQITKKKKKHLNKNEKIYWEKNFIGKKKPIKKTLENTPIGKTPTGKKTIEKKRPFGKKI